MKRVVVSNTNIRRVRKRRPTGRWVPYGVLLGTLMVGIALSLLYMLMRSSEKGL